MACRLAGRTFPLSSHFLFYEEISPVSSSPGQGVSTPFVDYASSTMESWGNAPHFHPYSKDSGVFFFRLAEKVISVLTESISHPHVLDRPSTYFSVLAASSLSPKFLKSLRRRACRFLTPLQPITSPGHFSHPLFFFFPKHISSKASLAFFPILSFEARRLDRNPSAGPPQDKCVLLFVFFPSAFLSSTPPAPPKGRQ